jgi:hypothetical protein
MEKVSKAVASDVQASFRRLAQTASQLNFVSDALGKYIAEIESGLRTLNLGVPSWVTIEKFDSNDGLVTLYRELGYDKVGKNWCIALRSFREAPWSDDYIDYEVWAFDDGPRWLRIQAIDQLPALLQQLNSDAANVAKDVAEKLRQACDVASEISAVVDNAKKDPPQGKTR